jgi:hypothetical protein
VGMNIRPVCVVISVALSGLVASCGSSTTAPTSTLTPIAVSPNNSASISQNNSATGCSLLATDAGGGFGFTIQFQWAPPSQADGIVGYEIYATNTSVPLPVLDAIVQTTTTNYTMTQCNSYVIDVHLQAWQW